MVNICWMFCWLRRCAEKQNDSQFIVNKNNKGQLDETFLPENSQKSENFVTPRKARKSGNESKYIVINYEKICIATV